MKDTEIYEMVLNARKYFGVKCNKFVGAVMVEAVKRGLEENGILISPQNVFIKGLPIEIDLLMPKKDVVPKYSILYEPQDVLAALEIRSYGTFGEKAVNSVKKQFEQIKQLNKKIYCAYVTLGERKDYKWVVTEKNIGCPAFTLFWHTDWEENLECTGDWEKLLKVLLIKTRKERR